MAEKQHRYLPHLRWKLNEQIALRNLSAESRSAVTPLIVLGQEQFAATKTKPPRVAKSARPPPSAADIFVKQVVASWGTGEILLDASDLPGEPGGHYLDGIAAVARSAGLKLVPAMRLTSPEPYQQAVARMWDADNRGGVLRISLPEMTSAATWARSWPYDPSSTDLVVDLMGSVKDVAALGMSAAHAFATLHQGKQWRSVTMAGGCIPQTLTGYKVGATPILREELKFWQTLVAHRLPYRLDFGDYCSLSPDAPTGSIPAPVPINAKYSLADRFLIFHGVKIKGPGAIPMDRQLRSYAQAIVAHPNRNRLEHCWADARIDNIAATGTESPGNPGVWIGLNVNRHIEITRNTLP